MRHSLLLIPLKFFARSNVVTVPFVAYRLVYAIVPPAMQARNWFSPSGVFAVNAFDFAFATREKLSWPVVVTAAHSHFSSFSIRSCSILHSHLALQATLYAIHAIACTSSCLMADMTPSTRNTMPATNQNMIQP